MSHLLCGRGPRGWLTRRRVRPRIAGLNALVPLTIREMQETFSSEIMSIYALGSAVWEPNPRDIDLVVVLRGEHPLELWNGHETLGQSLDIRVVGLSSLARAVTEGAVGEVRLHYECLTLYAIAV